MEAKVIVTTELQLKALIADAVGAAFKYYNPTSTTVSDTEPYGDFNWLLSTCAGIPASTLRIKSASGEIPGVVKFGKRVLYEKAVVLNWLRSQTRQAVDMTKVEQTADLQVNAQIRKRSQKGGVHA